MINKVQLFSTANILILLQPIFNSLLASATAYESQATACDIEITLDLLWIGGNCIFNENMFFYELINIFFQQKYFISIFITFCTTCKHFTL